MSADFKIELVDVKKLVPYELNSKIHDEAQVSKISESIKRFGWDQPIVVDKDFVVIKGHGRRLAAIKLGLATVPVLVRRDLTPEQVRAARLADNRVAMGGIDTDLLKQELENLDYDLTGIFDDKELQFMDSDLFEITSAAFVEDLDDAIASHAGESAERIEAADARPVKIDAALGFKTIPGSAEREIAFFMALIESETGLVGSDAFVKFASEYKGKEEEGDE